MQPLDRGSPAPKAGPEIWVRRLTSGESILFGIASPAPWEFWIHWDGPARKSEPCFRDHKKCPGHIRGLPRKWRGYLFGLNHAERRYEYLEVTPRDVEILQNLVGDLANLRGMRVNVTRGKADTARKAFSRVVDWDQYTTAKLAEDKDPQATLLRLWGYEDAGEKPSFGMVS